MQKTPDVARCMLATNQQDGSVKFVMEGFNFFKLFENQDVSCLGVPRATGRGSGGGLFGALVKAREVSVASIVFMLD